MAALPPAFSMIPREHSGRRTRLRIAEVDGAWEQPIKLPLIKAEASTVPVVSLSKRDYARRHSSSERTVDNWVADGCPTLRYSRRKVLFPVDLADAWLREKFLVARRKPSTARLRVTNVPAATPTAEGGVHS
jgi:hypothetical protein